MGEHWTEHDTDHDPILSAGALHQTNDFNFFISPPSGPLTLSPDTPMIHYNPFVLTKYDTFTEHRDHEESKEYSESV